MNSMKKPLIIISILLALMLLRVLQAIQIIYKKERNRICGYAAFIYYFNSIITSTSRACEIATSSISVTNLFPHSMRCMAFLSTSKPKICNLSANALCDVLGFICNLYLAIFFPQIFAFPSFALFLNIIDSLFDIHHLSFCLLYDKI